MAHKTSVLRFSVGPALTREYERLAERGGMTKSDLFRRIVTTYKAECEDEVTFPQFRGHRVKPPPSSLRTRLGSHSRGSSDGVSDYRTPQCTRRYPVSRRHVFRSADGTRARA